MLAVVFCIALSGYFSGMMISLNSPQPSTFTSKPEPPSHPSLSVISRPFTTMIPP